MPDETKLTARERIYAERERQIKVEGWSYAHDDGDLHRDGQMFAAGRAYLNTAILQQRYPWFAAEIPDDIDNCFRIELSPVNWPWEDRWFKPGQTPEPNLRKAGALFLAEIDRLGRDPGKLDTVAIDKARSALAETIELLDEILKNPPV